MAAAGGINLGGMKASGVTLIEIVIVLAVLGVLLTVAYAFARPSTTERAAQAVRSAVLWARANAMWRGVSVAVTQTPDGFVIRAADDTGLICSQGPQLVSVTMSEHPGVSVVSGLPRGLVWLADGSGRTCDGGGVISATVVLSDARRTYNVVVSSLGRVRVEAVP